ncbi:MAG: SGNH/GDSL hydrolase family protein [Sandaracinus sp.]|nr:SGNH/GDSL hydrolase family protein [Sandaracinus sp.]MCB9632669.1 SGNH/GDSL hydrolase family protein [Sandaracinus sp.]
MRAWPLLFLLGCTEVVLVDARRDAGRDGGSFSDAAPVDASFEDSSLGDAGGSDAGPPPTSGPVLYPVGDRHSPISTDLATALAARATMPRDEDVFMKVGDSITVSTAFLNCFAGTNVDLDGRPLDATLTHFRGGDAAGSSPFTRDSRAAVVGWSANAPLAGDPSPLDQEHAALDPRFAVVMYGTNDVGFRETEAFARDLWTITDTLLARGTIPLLSSIPPRDDSASADAKVPLYNLAVRALAQGRGVPFVDYHRELLPLANHGLAGDGVHPQVAGAGGCVLTADALRQGYNVRNLLVLEQLDRARRALGGEALDAAPPRLGGTGTSTDPHVVTSLPFAAMGDTRGAPSDAIDVYGCSSANESGPERFYRFELASRTTVRVAALSASGVDVDVHVVDDTATGAGCVMRANRELEVTLDAGTWFVVVDSFVDGTPLAGEYLVVIEPR